MSKLRTLTKEETLKIAEVVLCIDTLRVYSQNLMDDYQIKKYIDDTIEVIDQDYPDPRQVCHSSYKTSYMPTLCSIVHDNILKSGKSSTLHTPLFFFQSMMNVELTNMIEYTQDLMESLADNSIRLKVRSKHHCNMGVTLYEHRKPMGKWYMEEMTPEGKIYKEVSPSSVTETRKMIVPWQITKFNRWVEFLASIGYKPHPYWTSCIHFIVNGNGLRNDLYMDDTLLIRNDKIFYFDKTFWPKLDKTLKRPGTRSRKRKMKKAQEITEH